MLLARNGDVKRVIIINCNHIIILIDNDFLLRNRDHVHDVNDHVNDCDCDCDRDYDYVLNDHDDEGETKQLEQLMQQLKWLSFL